MAGRVVSSTNYKKKPRGITSWVRESSPLHLIYSFPPSLPPSLSPSHTPCSLHKVVVIAGTTAVGKTSLSLELARRLNGEVVSTDSVQVYWDY